MLINDEKDGSVIVELIESVQEFGDQASAKVPAIQSAVKDVIENTTFRSLSAVAAYAKRTSNQWLLDAVKDRVSTAHPGEYCKLPHW